VLVNGVLKERGETKSVRCENAIDTATAVAQVEGYARETLFGDLDETLEGCADKSQERIDCGKEIRQRRDEIYRVF
jgi:hypothetical protein